MLIAGATFYYLGWQYLLASITIAFFSVGAILTFDLWQKHQAFLAKSQKHQRAIQRYKKDIQSLPARKQQYQTKLAEFENYKAKIDD